MRLKTFRVCFPLLGCGTVSALVEDGPKPVPPTLLGAASLVTRVDLPEAFDLPTGIPEICAGGGSALVLLLLREKKEDELEGGFDMMEVSEVMDDLRDVPSGIFPF